MRAYERGHERLSVRSYRGVVRWSRDVSVGDWIFSKSDADGPYLDFLEENGVPGKVVDSALRFRDLVPSFLERIADEIYEQMKIQKDAFDLERPK